MLYTPFICVWCLNAVHTLYMRVVKDVSEEVCRCVERQDVPVTAAVVPQGALAGGPGELGQGQQLLSDLSTGKSSVIWQQASPQ